TLMKIIYGAVKPDAGTIFWEGKQVVIANPARARRLGIGMVFQHFSLFETLTVADNIALALEGDRAGAGLADRIRDVSTKYGLPLDPARYVHTMSVGERQRVEIVRCLLQDPRLLIMDEPTSVLTPQAVEKLFETLRRLSSEGCSILYISHKLDEIRALCHRATVLRAGEIVGIAGVSGNGQKELMAALSGERTVSDASVVRLMDRPVGRLDADARRALGLAFVPEERLGRGAVPEMTLAENALLSVHRMGLVRRGFVRAEAVREYARATIEAFNVKAGGPDAVARSLSGGNLQKFIVG